MSYVRQQNLRIIKHLYHTLLLILLLFFFKYMIIAKTKNFNCYSIYMIILLASLQGVIDRKEALDRTGVLDRTEESLYRRVLDRTQEYEQRSS